MIPQDLDSVTKGRDGQQGGATSLRLSQILSSNTSRSERPESTPGKAVATQFTKPRSHETPDNRRLRIRGLWEETERDVFQKDRDGEAEGEDIVEIRDKDAKDDGSVKEVKDDDDDDDDDITLEDRSVIK